LMTRVLQHLTTAPFFNTLVWVLFAASVEVLVVFFFGGVFAEAIMRGMGGMRNSPAEDVLVGAMGVAFVGSLWAAPIALVLSLVLRVHRLLQPLPILSARSFSIGSLAIAAVFWVGLSIVPQQQLARNIAVENLLAEGKTREALDYLSAHQPGQFAPARMLPPKPYEYSVFTELPACFDAVQPSDPAWVRALLVGRLDEMMVHYGPRRERLQSQSPDDQIKYIRTGVARYNPEVEGLAKLLNGLERIPEGRAWLAAHNTFVRALQQMASEPPIRTHSDSPPEEKQRADWSSLSNRLRDLLPESFITPATDSIEAPEPARGENSPN
jgi:hypothetical protein